MREHKYRAWDIKTKKMYDDSVICKDLGNWYIWIRNGETSYQIELMQFTGLHDKNGKEIYEGDIVEIPNFKEKWKRSEPKGNWRRFKVIWNQYVYAFENEWIYKPLSSYDTSDLMPYEIEIIGNIYENPELLTK